VLSGAFSADRADVSYEQLAAALRISEPAVKRLLHQLRQRFRTLLREEVAQTVEEEADVEDEIRYLCSVLAAGTH
jgi:RNA polymerase sigma-70 factor (ECF subfamily)